MIFLKGQVDKVGGVGHFRQRMTNFPEAFKRATGEELFKGTLNVNINRQLPVREHFRIRGTEINEPEQDLLFEVCRINGIWAYRIRPYNVNTGSGGHGDHILEIACSQEIPNVPHGSLVEIALFRNDFNL